MIEILEKTKTTASEYFQLPETNSIRELIDGEIFVNTPFVSHQNAVGNLYFLLRTLVSKGKVYSAPLAVYFDESNVLQPDILWVSGDENCLEIDGYLRGAPTLVVEVLSRSTAKRDRGAKFHLYEKFGVKEYWLVDTDEQFIQVFMLAEGGRFVQHVLATPETPFTSPALDKEVNIATIFA